MTWAISPVGIRSIICRVVELQTKKCRATECSRFSRVCKPAATAFSVWTPLLRMRRWHQEAAVTERRTFGAGSLPTMSSHGYDQACAMAFAVRTGPWLRRDCPTGCCTWSNHPRGYIALDDRWPVIHARRNFVVEATVVALRPTWPEGIRLKL